MGRQPASGPVFRVCYGTDNCTTSAHLLLRSRPRGFARPSNNRATAMSHRFTIDALKELIAARRDAEQGLRICAGHVRGSRMRVLVLSQLHDCAQALQELQSLIRLLGGDLEPPRDLAGAHRRWADLRAALACDGDGAILDECERGESRALEVYRNALDDPLPGLVRAIVLRQFEDVMTNHDQIRNLRSEPSLRTDPGAGSGAQAGQH
jgi:uncharacterized protein (TIGR02284 family)